MGGSTYQIYDYRGYNKATIYSVKGGGFKWIFFQIFRASETAEVPQKFRYVVGKWLIGELPRQREAVLFLPVPLSPDGWGPLVR